MSNYRNLTAHEDVCYDYKTQRSIDNTIYHQLLYIPKKDGEFIYGKNDLFALVIILKYVLNEDDFTMFMNEINYELDVLGGKLNSIGLDKILKRMGFPNNYKSLVRVNKNGKN